MKKHKRVISVIAISSLLAVSLLTGFKTASKAEQVTLKFTTWEGADGKKSVDATLAKFHEKYPNITVEQTAFPTDYDTKITTMIAGNEAPDIGYLETATNAFPLAEQGKVMNLNDFLKNDSTFDKKSIIASSTYYWAPGKMLSFATPEVFQLFYNPEMFKEAGVELPPTKAEKAWTWKQFVDVCKKLTKDKNGKYASQPGFDPKNIVQYGTEVNTWWGAYANFLVENGADFISKDGKSFALNKPEATEVFQNMADLMNVYHVAPSPSQMKAMPAQNLALQTKKVAMVIDGQWNNMSISQTGMKYGVGVLPSYKGKSMTIVVCGATAIFAGTKHPKEAWELYKFLIDPQNGMDNIKGGLWMPAIKDWYVKPDLIAKWADPSYAARPLGYQDAVMKQAITNSVSGPTFYVKNFNKIMDVVGPALDKVWAGKQTAKAAMAAIAVKAQAQVKGRR